MEIGSSIEYGIQLLYMLSEKYWEVYSLPTLEKCSYCPPKKIQTLLLVLEALEEVLEFGVEEKWITEADTSSSPYQEGSFLQVY